MFDFLIKSNPQRMQSLQKRGLTPNDSRALFALEKEGKPIGVLARELACDPSNATWLVDRLERAGLAERRSGEQDRRIKFVMLTTNGKKAIDELLREYHRPPTEFSRLSVQEVRDLCEILKKLHGLERVDLSQKRKGK